eukprot:163206-Chlamydomonas_euryale.AAC.17
MASPARRLFPTPLGDERADAQKQRTKNARWLNSLGNALDNDLREWVKQDGRSWGALVRCAGGSDRVQVCMSGQKLGRLDADTVEKVGYLMEDLAHLSTLDEARERLKMVVDGDTSQTAAEGPDSDALAAGDMSKLVHGVAGPARQRWRGRCNAAASVKAAMDDFGEGQGAARSDDFPPACALQRCQGQVEKGRHASMQERVDDVTVHRRDSDVTTAVCQQNLRVKLRACCGGA